MPGTQLSFFEYAVSSGKMAFQPKANASPRRKGQGARVTQVGDTWSRRLQCCHSSLCSLAPELAASNAMVSRQIGTHQIPISHSALAQHRGVRWCWTCGNYSIQHGHGLLRECPGRPTRGGRQVLQRLSQGMPPRADMSAWTMTEAEAPPSTL